MLMKCIIILYSTVHQQILHYWPFQKKYEIKMTRIDGYISSSVLIFFSEYFVDTDHHQLTRTWQILRNCAIVWSGCSVTRPWSSGRLLHPSRTESKVVSSSRTSLSYEKSSAWIWWLQIFMLIRLWFETRSTSSTCTTSSPTSSTCVSRMASIGTTSLIEWWPII